MFPNFGTLKLIHFPKRKFKSIPFLEWFMWPGKQTGVLINPGSRYLPADHSEAACQSCSLFWVVNLMNQS